MPQRNDALRRHAALEKTLKKYRGRPFEWGKADCVLMLRSHLIAMGHKGLPKAPRYKDAVGAKRALQALGHDTVESLLDAHLARITPAAMLPGDVAVMEGEGMAAVSICVGRKVVGFHQSADGAVVMIPHEIKAAWRG